VVILALTSAIAGCHKKPPALSPTPASAVPSRPAAPPTPPAPAPPPSRVAAAPHTSTEDELFAAKSLDQLNAEHPLGDAYFDYDQDSLRDDARAALQRDAQWLRRWQQARITIQGQCDERGTAEYNLALGERRAAVVREYLVNLGIPERRLTVVSLGKESPVCTEDVESCWSKNRRGHMVISAK
jgi:peptidoglycan-associated lipoprotein